MALQEKDIINISSELIHQVDNIDLIVKYTDNTWQKNRNELEKTSDTDQGKRAEEAVQIYLDKEKDITYIPYDDFRTDNFEKYAPFDGIAFAKETSIKLVTKIIQKINNEISQSSFGNISPELRSEIYKNGIRCIEIKSTKVNKKKLDEKGNVAFDKILDNHFLTYPLYARSGNFNIREYVFYAKKKMELHGFLDYEDLVKKIMLNEKIHSSDIYIHVYMDDSNYYIIGYITKEVFYELAEMNKLIKPGKSKYALYFIVSLRNGFPIANIRKEF
jgi:hypothetical protein